MATKVKPNQNPEYHSKNWTGNWHWSGRGKLSMAGVLLIVIGLYYFGKAVGWFDPTLPFWPIILIAIGLVFVVNSLRPKKVS